MELSPWERFTQNLYEQFYNENADRAAMKNWKLKDFLDLAYRVVDGMDKKPADWKHVIDINFKNIDRQDWGSRYPTLFDKLYRRMTDQRDFNMGIDLASLLENMSYPSSPVAELKDEEDERLAREQNRYPARDDSFRPSYYGRGKREREPYNRLTSAIEQVAKKFDGDIQQVKLRFQQPRRCKVSLGNDDPSLYTFGKKAWLYSKIGNTPEYAIAPSKASLDVQDAARVTDMAFQKVTDPALKAALAVYGLTYLPISYMENKEVIEILLQGRAVLGTIGMYELDDQGVAFDGHSIAFIIVPEIIDDPIHGNLPMTCYLLETYNLGSDAIKNAFEHYLNKGEFDPDKSLGPAPIKVERINATQLQNQDALCSSWSLMMLYYLAKEPVPHFEMVDGVEKVVNKPLRLNNTNALEIKTVIQKLKDDMGGQFVPEDANASVFPKLFGTARPQRGAVDPDDDKEIVTFKEGEKFKHGSKQSFAEFSANFPTRPYIWTFKWDAGEAYNSNNFYLTVKDKVNVFNLTTHKGTTRFLEVMEVIGKGDLAELLYEKMINQDEFMKGGVPLYKSPEIDRLLAKGLADTEQFHGMGGWKLKLKSASDPEYLFFNPSTKFTISKKP